MKKIIFGFCFILAIALPVFGQTPATPPPARPAPPPPIVSPEVHPDRRVTFRLRAPQSKEVSVSGEWAGGGKAIPMTKDEKSVWSVTVGPIEPDLYGYGFTVDGVGMLDPSNTFVKPMRSSRTSVLEVLADKLTVQDFQDVPHGTVHIHTYRSKAVDAVRSLHVYTPPGYDKITARFPVLYLFHGSGDNDATWTAVGRAHFILDNLIAQGKAKPMVVVMTDGHAAPNTPEARGRNTELFSRDLMGEVMPLVEANYRVKNDRLNRAIVGLSMGGGQSLTVGLNHPELFAWVGGMSSSINAPEQTFATALGDAKVTNAKYKLVWLGIGKDDFLLKANQQFDELLTAKGIKHTFKLTEGNHSWPVWRRYLVDFAPLLFVQ
ncbi:MAG: alpha/beta hydrolase-fold protein [Blastocatellia bacterium]